MWQSSMLINLLNVPIEQIYVPIWAEEGFFCRVPITRLDQMQ